MYTFIKLLVPFIALGGIIYIFSMKKKYQNDSSSTKEDIIKYFQENRAIDYENGIRVKDLPIDISKNPYLLLMVQDKTLIFKKGKYYLNSK